MALKFVRTLYRTVMGGACEEASCLLWLTVEKATHSVWIYILYTHIQAQNVCHLHNHYIYLYTVYYSITKLQTHKYIHLLVEINDYILFSILEV